MLSGSESIGSDCHGKDERDILEVLKEELDFIREGWIRTISSHALAT